MKTIGLVLEPLDTLFFRSGRPFGAGLPGESGLPGPQVFAGALRTFLLDRTGADFEAMRGQPSLAEAFAAAGASWLADVRFRGPWLADIARPKSPEPFLSPPADLVMQAGRAVTLRPLSSDPPGWKPAESGMRPLWLKGGKHDKDLPGLLTWAGLGSYLRNEELKATQMRLPDALYSLEERTGVTVDSSRQAAAEGLIYATRALRLARNVAFYGEVDLPEDRVALFDGEPTLPWGGERHHVLVRRVQPVLWPAAGDVARKLVLLVAPAFFSPIRWRPREIAQGTLRAAAVSGPFAVSGWDLAKRGPKPTRFGVAPGSVYFLEGGDAPQGRQLTSGEDAALGYGFFLRGTWDYA